MRAAYLQWQPDDSMNLVISLSVKQLNPAVRVVARCHDLKNAEKILRAGADEIVLPDFTGGLHIVSAMVRPHVMSFLDDMLRSDSSLRMEEFAIPQGLSGKALSALQTAGHDLIVLAIRRDGQWLFNPDGRQPMLSGDVLMVMTTPAGRNGIEQLIQEAKSDKSGRM
jgi:voltage-gated potassium channel